MAKSVTVNFDDGSSYIYDNVPDDVTDDQVTQRAGQDFGDKTITGVSGGAPASAGGAPVAPQPLTTGEKIGGAVGMGAQFVEEHPGLIAGAYGLYKAGKVADTYMKGKQVEIEAAKTAAKAAEENRILQRERIAERAARTSAPVQPQPQPQTGIVDAQGRPISAAPAEPVAPVEPQAPRGPTTMQNAARPMPPQTGGPAAQEGANFLENIAKKYAPAVSRMGTAIMDNPIMRGVGQVARVAGSAPVMGAQMALTPGNVGQNYNFPTRGPMAGNEINPRTGRPWTPQELSQYYSTVR